MRENMGLCRGKWVDNGEWVEGHYARFYDGEKEKYFIFPGYADFDCGEVFPERCEVDPNTIGQSTGLVDKNGVKVFEGDVVHNLNRCSDLDAKYGVIRFGHYRHNDASRQYMCGDYGFYVDWPRDSNLRPDIMYWLEHMEVIGNIRDTPELLEAAP